MNANAKFTQGSLMRHISVMSFTASIGLMAIFLVDFVDMIFISMLGQKELAAAIGYAGAILFFTVSIGIGLSIASGALVARALGEGNADRHRQLATHTIAIAVLVSVVVAALVSSTLGFWTSLVGASGETRELAISYLAIIVPSMPLIVIGITGSAILRAHGEAQKAMLVTLAGGLANALLDPLFIFGLGLGLDGAAIASVSARFVMAGSALWLLIRRLDALAPFTPPGMIRDFGATMSIALPAMLTNIATPVGQAYVTRTMAEFGEAAVSAMAVIGRLTPIAFAVVFSLSGAIGPIIAQNAGAGASERVRRSFVDALIFTGVYTLVVTAILFALRGQIAVIFNADEQMRNLIYLFCGPLALLFFFNGAIFVFNAGFNNLGRPLWSTGVNWGRNTIGTIPLVAAGAWAFGAAGVLIGQAIGGILFAAIGGYGVIRLLGDSEGIEKQPTRTDRFNRHIRMVQIFDRRR